MLLLPQPVVAEGSIRLGILKACCIVIQSQHYYRCRGLDPIGDTESKAVVRGTWTAVQVAEGSIRLGILKEDWWRTSAIAACVAEGSIRLGILKVYRVEAEGPAPLRCRGLDPIGDTESSIRRPAGQPTFVVAEGSIRLGILKAVYDDIVLWMQKEGCRGLDPIGDTESRLGHRLWLHGVGCRGLDPIGDTERP